MEVQYSYDTNSLLGSSALGRFDFSFGEDPGSGSHPHIGQSAVFRLPHRSRSSSDRRHRVPRIQYRLTHLRRRPERDQLHRRLCDSGCNLSQGIFTDTQSLNAQIDAASDGSAQILNSLNTFRVGFTSDLPFVSADGRTGGAASTVPEPSLAVVLGFVLAGLVVANRRQMNRKREIEP